MTAETIRALTTDEAAVLELPEDRVAAFVEAWRRYAEPDAAVNSIAAVRLEAGDLADVLRELEAWRALAHNRLAIINTLAAQLAEASSPWKVGDPDPTPGLPRYCDAEAPEPQNGYCTWGPGHTEPVHVAGNGAVIVAVWAVEEAAEPGEPITTGEDD